MNKPNRLLLPLWWAAYAVQLSNWERSGLLSAYVEPWFLYRADGRRR